MTIKLTEHRSIHPDIANSKVAGMLPAAAERELAKMNPMLAEQLRELIQSKADINQGNATTCTQTAMMYELAKNNPAELIRIVSELSRNGKTKLQDGTVVTLAKEAMSQDTVPAGMPFVPRNTVERIFQDSMFNAFCITRTSDGVVEKGMTPDCTRRMLQAVYGKEYISVGRAADLQKVFAEIAADPSKAYEQLAGTQLVLNWMSGGKDALHAASFAGARIDEQGNIKIKIFHGWGEGTARGGDIARTRDDATGIEEIDFSEFQKRTVGMHIPGNALIQEKLGLATTMDEMTVPVTTTFFAAPSIFWGSLLESLQQSDQKAKQKREEYFNEVAQRSK